jgi:hypothetical protein
VEGSNLHAPSVIIAILKSVAMLLAPAACWRAMKGRGNIALVM